MRRLALVASAGGASARERELDEVHRWLGALPSHGVRHYRQLADVPLEQSDVLWVRGAADDDPRLLAWLRTGGRMLATHDGVLLSTALGLTRDPPATVSFPHPSPPGFGLAGFGPHPLFAGLRDGAVLTPTFDDGPPALRCYAGPRPADGAVIAVARRGLELDPDTVLAWEYAVGAGGMLCLGFHPSLLTAGDPTQRRAGGHHVLKARILQRLRRHAGSDEAGKFTLADAKVLSLFKPGLPALLVANKLDQVHRRGDIAPWLRDMQQRHDFAEFVPMSAKSAQDVQRLRGSRGWSWCRCRCRNCSRRR